uniref:Uncharacterized protein n=1 Tax=Trichuris muris TaxID=70415 RepID=A0A5S6QSC9_TRIMR
MFSKVSIFSVVLIIIATCFYECVSKASGTEKTFEETRKSLLRQEQDYLSVNSYVRDKCEEQTCSSEYVKLRNAIASTGLSNLQISSNYQKCMLPCIRQHKPEKAKEEYSDGSSALSSSDE